jgi:hypothetical protein
MDCHATLAMTEVVSLCLCEEWNDEANHVLINSRILKGPPKGGGFAPKDRQKYTTRFGGWC